MNTYFIFSFIISFIFALIGFKTLHNIKKSNLKTIRKWLHIPARKSNSDAVLLGGGVIALCSTPLFWIAGHTTPFEKRILIGAMIAQAVVVIHGYLDDKFEITPKAKLLCQLFSVGVIGGCLLTTQPYAILPFAVLVVGFWGFGVLNGNNLLDGLDTLQIKLNIVTCSIYAIIATFFSLPHVATMSLLVLAPLLAFYFFNKEPAKIHMGEIGANSIGVNHLLLSSLLFIGLATKIGTIQAFAISIFPLSLPITELAVSFLRRWLSCSSPFRSDRKHLHHILTGKLKFSSAGASSVITLAYMTLVLPALAITLYVSPIVGSLCYSFSLIAAYFHFGRKFWFKNEFSGRVLEAHNISNFLKKKCINVINTNAIDDFQMIIPKKNEVEEHYRKVS